MQNLIPKFGQISIVSEEPGYLSEKLKTLVSSNYHRVCFWLKFCSHFLLYNVYNSVQHFFISFIPWAINKNVKKPGFCGFINQV